jgi:hypothetical protein
MKRLMVEHGRSNDSSKCDQQQCQTKLAIFPTPITALLTPQLCQLLLIGCRLNFEIGGIFRQVQPLQARI